MKKALRKYLSVERRDLWDGPKCYILGHLPTDKLKFMLKHKSNRDRRIKEKIQDILVMRGVEF